MRALSVSLTALVVLLMVGFSGCGKETVTTIAPVVATSTPANGSTGVPINTAPTATFSVAMNASTVNTSTFTLTGPGGVTVAGNVTYVAGTSAATFTPATLLAYNTLYTATVTTGVTDTIGDKPAANYGWSFTTVTQPTVVTVTPAPGATSVPIKQVLTATFSKAMNPATITPATFLLNVTGGAAVSGVVTYNATTFVATFAPNVNLAYNTQYTATITTGVTDSTGDPMAANYPWSFTTGVGPIVIATVPVNGATGVPLTQVLSATFNRPMNCATLATPATSFTLTASGVPVAGVVGCSGSVATFTPGVALLVNTVYTAMISTAATDSTGIPLSTNYVWTFRTVPTASLPTVISTVPANGATVVPVSQAVSATFSEAMNPATINGTTFTLKAGAVAVTGVVTYSAAGSVATFTPATALAVSTLYTATITTGAQDLGGNALTTNYVWTFTTAATADTTKPTVIATIPLNGSTAVFLNTTVSATFSKAMNAATINSSTFTLTGPGLTPVAGQVNYASVSHQAIFTPSANLAINTLYTATITTGVTDLSGNTLAVNYVWTFTTGALLGTTKPEIVSTTPANAATNIPLNQAVSATFTEAMNPLTLTTATFTLTGPGATSVAGTVSYDSINFIATFTPTSLLTTNTSYVANITSGVTDMNGNSLGVTGAPNPWTFVTGTTLVVPPVNLGSTVFYGGFGGNAGMTNQGIFTVINGSIGTTGVSTKITGFHDNGVGCVYTETPLNVGYVNGAINTAPPPPTVACPTEGTAVTQAIAAQAALDALAAYNALVAFPNGLDVSTCPGCGGGLAGELGNRTLLAGTYKSAPGTYAISQGDLTLDAQGNPNAYWVFQMATTLTVGTPTAHRNVLLVNGAQAKNVFWQVGTAATINGILGGGTMTGTIISQAGISVSTAGVVAITTVNGRLLVLSGPVTIVNTVVNVPAQ